MKRFLTHPAVVAIAMALNVLALCAFWMAYENQKTTIRIQQREIEHYKSMKKIDDQVDEYVRQKIHEAIENSERRTNP